MNRQHGYSVRERSRGHFQIRIDAGSDPVTGTRRVVSFTFKGSRRGATEAAQTKLGEVRIGEHVDAADITMRDHLTAWLTAVEKAKRASTHRRYSSILRHHLIPALGALKLSKLAAADLDPFYARMARHDGRGETLSALTVRQIHQVLRQSLAWAVTKRLIKFNPTDAFCKTQPRIESDTREHVLEPEQQRQLLAAAKGTRAYLPILIGLTTGARLGEIVALRWRSIDLDRGMITISESVSYDTNEIGETKTGKVRKVTAPKMLIAELHTYRTAQRELMFSLGQRLGLDDFLCPPIVGNEICSRSIGQAFRRLIKNMPKDFPQVRFHDLRHTHCVQLLRAHVLPKVVAERLGHSSVVITLQRYAHALPSMQEEAAERIDEALQAVS